MRCDGLQEAPRPLVLMVESSALFRRGAVAVVLSPLGGGFKLRFCLGREVEANLILNGYGVLPETQKTFVSAA